MDIDNLPAKEQKELDDLGKEIVEGIIRSEIAEGRLNVECLSKDEAHAKAVEHLGNLIKEDEFTHMTLIHKDGLLEEARKYLKNKKQELAIVMFGTWWEHWLNGLIADRVIHQGLNENDYKDIVRSLNNKAKSTWQFKLLKLPPLETDELKVISTLIEKRNQFVHYKYPKKEWEQDDDLPDEYFIKLEQSINYFISYEESHIYKNFRLS